MLSNFDSAANQLRSPIISVAMPVFNGDKYLAEAIDSILVQTFSNFEFIIIDDGSTDGSLDILRHYERQDPRIRLIARENKNVAATLNEIILLSRGKWFARMDQDDISLPQRFERQLQWLNMTGADICGGWIQLFGTINRRILKHPQTDDAIKTALLFGSSFSHPTVMVSLAKIKELMYDEMKWEAEDYDLWVRAAGAGWVMTNMTEVLLRYRTHPMQISSKNKIAQQQLSNEIRKSYWRHTFEVMNLKEEWVEEIFKLRESPPGMVSMNIIDMAFALFLRQSHGESRVIIFDHLTRLYFRAAATCPDIAFRWWKLNDMFGCGHGRSTFFQLWLMSIFKIKPDSKLFFLIKNLYFFCVK
jgi:glycosyltransferase involved in cell wall biosynthesis